jgi:hypothetical protein
MRLSSDGVFLLARKFQVRECRTQFALLDQLASLAPPCGAEQLVDIRAAFIGEQAALVPRPVGKNEDVLGHGSTNPSCPAYVT